MNKIELFLRRILTPLGRGTLKRLVIAFCANEEFVLQNISVERVVTRVEDFVEGLPFLYFMGVKLMIFMFEFATPPLAWKILPMSCLSAEKRVRYVHRWAESKWNIKRLAYVGMKFLCLSQVYSERALLEAIGYGEDFDARVGNVC